MAEITGIEWADATVNWWIGCTRTSRACDHCYAEAWAARFDVVKWGPRQARKSRFQAAFLEAAKLHQRAARRGRVLNVFSNSLSDLFDAEVPDEWRDYAIARMILLDRLRWLVLTKRAKVMRDYMADLYAGRRDLALTLEPKLRATAEAFLAQRLAAGVIPNVWLGVTAEDQVMADQRVPLLLETPAAGRFVSAEPLLGPVDLHLPDGDVLLDWVIAGGESGHGARPPHPDHLRALRDQCAAAGVAFFFKQWGQWRPGVHARAGRPGPFAYFFPERIGDTQAQWTYPGQALEADLAARTTAQMTRCQMKKQAGALLDGQRVQQFPACFDRAGSIAAAEAAPKEALP